MSCKFEEICKHYEKSDEDTEKCNHIYYTMIIDGKYICRCIYCGKEFVHYTDAITITDSGNNLVFCPDETSNIKTSVKYTNTNIIRRWV